MTKTPPPKLPGRDISRRRARPGAGRFGELLDDGRLRTVALDAILPNPHQPRRNFDDQALQNLTESIAARGVLQPPVVRVIDGGYELIAGERRCRAARLAGLTEIEVLVGDHNDAASLQDALMENVARQDLSPIEAARAYATIIDDLGLTREELGRRIGTSRVSISNHLRLLDLPDLALELIDTGQLTFAHGRALLLTPEHAQRTRLAQRAVDDHWTTRELEQAARDAGAPRSRQKHAPAATDAAAAAECLDAALSTATGLDIAVRITARGAVTITLSDLASARTLATQLGVEISSLDEPSP